MIVTTQTHRHERTVPPDGDSYVRLGSGMRGDESTRSVVASESQPHELRSPHPQQTYTYVYYAAISACAHAHTHIRTRTFVIISRCVRAHGALCVWLAVRTAHSPAGD